MINCGYDFLLSTIDGYFHLKICVHTCNIKVLIKVKEAINLSIERHGRC